MTSPSEPVKTRRRYTPSFKATIVQACQAPGASIAEVSRRHQLNANLVHKWIKKAKRAQPGSSAPGFVALPTPPSSSDSPIRLTIPTAQGNVLVEWPAEQAMQSAQWLKAVLS